MKYSICSGPWAYEILMGVSPRDVTSYPFPWSLNRAFKDWRKLRTATPQITLSVNPKVALCIMANSNHLKH